MKKFLVMVAAAMMATVNLNAQTDDLKNEIGITYGVGLSTIGDGIGSGTFGIFDSMFGYEWANRKDFGTLGVEYFRHLGNPRLAVGGIVAFASYSEDLVSKSDGQKAYERTRNYITVMPAIKYYWVNKNHFGLYSKAAVGGMLMIDKQKKMSDGSTSSDNTLYINFQASLLGLEAGSKNVRGFLEAGAGEQGFALLGLRCKF